MKDIVIIGAGGVGRETAQLIEDINNEKRQWNLLGFIDDNKELHGRSINGYEVLGGIEFLNSLVGKYSVVCTISNLSLKMRFEQTDNSKMEYAKLIHPNTMISKHVDMGEYMCSSLLLYIN